jgi:gamma-glutamyltranspeptidase / glutathione hydrolase
MKGVVAAGHHVTAEAGAEVLRQGGNAFDAAVCAVLTSFASESTLTGLGAGGFLLAHTAAGEDHLFDFFVEAGGRGLDASGRADLVAVEVLFEDVTQIFNIGPASCGVPGTAAGLWEVADRLCTMPFAELAAPAIRCAREGVRVTPEQAYIFTLLESIVTYFPEASVLYAPDGNLLAAGDLFKFPDLAVAIERLAEDGPRTIYAGDTAKRISDWLCERGGLISIEDLAAYEVIEREPVRARYRQRDVLTNAPPSSGGILIAFALDLLERSPRQPPAGSGEGLALLAEVMAEANRARAGAHFNEELHEDGFARRFLSGPHIDEALRGIEERLGAHGGTTLPTESDRLGSTTHISVLDDDGNAASVTCSNGTGSGVVVPGTGIQLNNMLGEEDLNPLGYHMHEPGTRVTSMMAPTLVLKEGKIELTLGSAGSNRLRSAILQTIRYVVDEGMSVHEAIRAGRLHYESGILHAEPGIEKTALAELERRGYKPVRWRGINPYFGGAQAARRDPVTGKLSGAGDPRRGGTAVVVQ